MSEHAFSADELTLPIKRTEGDTLKERLTDNAYHNILPARYLKKNADGNLVEEPEDLFKRVGKNIALAEAVYEADRQGVEVTVTPDQVKPDHPRRDDLAAEVFGAGTTADDDVETVLTEHNVSKFAYDTVVPELPTEIREHVVDVADEFTELMERLSFIPNSPTLMNAGDELQQLSACFVDSPQDDLTDIHETAREAAEVFQCLTDDSTVMVDGKGIVSVAEVEVGDRVAQRTESGFQYKPVEEVHAYDDAPTLTVEFANGLSVRGTPNHRIKVDGEWTRLDEIRAGQDVHYALGWLRKADREIPQLASVAADGQWDANRAVENAEIVELYREGLSDYEIAERLDCGTSTVQRRRNDELQHPPNGSGGRSPGSTTFDESTALALYQDGHTDAEIAGELGVHQTTVGQFRAREQLTPNGTPAKPVTQPTHLTEELAELVGIWIGDGSWHQDGVRFHVGRESVAEYIDQLSQKLFDTSTSISFSDGCYEVGINSHEIKRWWQANFDCKTDGAQSAHVPSVVKEAPADTIKAFLRGYFTADGTLLNDTYPKLYSSSERAIDDVATLMMGLGYPVKKSVIRDEETHPYYGLIPTTGDGRKTFLREVGFIDERNEIGLSNIESVNARDSHVVGDDYTVEVDTVTESEPATVYDITVADNHEYVTDGIVSHNSGGGMGYAFWRLRPYGDAVGSTGGIASGPITFMETFDQMCETIAQGGARRGAQMAIMRVSHPDVIEFIHSKNKDVSLAHTLKLNDPDDYTYTTFSEALEEARELIDDEGRVPKHLRNAVEGHLSNFNISVGVTDGFMEALQNGEEYTFVNPRTGDPHIATEETKEMYSRYGLGEHVEPGEELSIPAELVWERIVDGAHENGEPGVVYLDRINQEHSFPVESTPTGDSSEYEILATNPCITGDTKIVTADGRGGVSIEELAEEGEDVPVYCLNEETGDVEIQMGRNPRLTRRNAELVEIRTDGDVFIRCTPDHEIPTQNRGTIEAADLNPGDSLHILPQSSEVTETPTTATATNHKVESVESAGQGDVYNITVEEHHNYYAGINAENDVYINVLNCGEQPLMEYEACNLGHINLSTIADFEAPDWRVWADEHRDEYDSLEDAVDAFLEDAIDMDEFDHRIEWGTRFLENVVTMSDFPVEEISETVRRNRKVGLGIMGLAQLYVQLGVKYGSEVANEIARQLMVQINHGSKWTSHELAEERTSFANWSDSKYAEPTAHREWFEHQTGLDADEWADGFPIRNHNTTTIAPTGTTSMVGNTTGGCEPMYNVAYYKNVSDDVQGDEMLVEFDDYFLRTLEANDIDVEAVKAEAQEQMANNEFDGVEGLTTVPDAIGELFVITADLAAKDHAAVQCACQQGVDSAISKTVNAPNDATVEDAMAAFEYIYENGGKGVTYYRDGTRSKQVLTTRAQNAEFADMDEDEAAAALMEQIEDVFGGLDGFLDHESVRADVVENIEDLVEPAELDIEEEAGYAKKRPRPDVLTGVTQRIETGYGKLYVNINEDPEGRPFELFANIGNSGGFTASFTEALAKTISTALRAGVDPQEIADELQGIRSPKVAWDKGEQIQSIPDAIGTAMRRYLDDEIEKSYPQQRNLDEIAEVEADTDADVEARDPEPEPDGGATVESGPVDAGTTTSAADDQQSIIDAGESPECPECGSLSLHYSEGCKTCASCGWSEC